MIGQNEIGPVNIEEMAACVFMLLFTSIVNANLFGEMAVLIQTIEKKKTNAQMRLDTANSVMSKIQIPPLLQEDVHDFFHLTELTREQQMENDRFFDTISPPLKRRVQQNIFESNLRKNKIIIQMIGEVKLQSVFVQHILSDWIGLNIAPTIKKTKTILIKSQKQQRNEELLNHLVSRLQTAFANPEGEIIKQGEKTSDLYFLSKGDCVVNVVDE